ncbi:hypothetical protein BC829DRAFT_424442 [Chytridium lagenaria]|nr:hypothetical protein BC829DRAFT_424442 [Chytridium lagenaria]
MSRFVRASKYRHVFGTPAKKDQCYDNLKVSRAAWDTNLVKANPLFISVNIEAGGGGAFAVIPLGTVGKLDPPLFTGHTGPVLDTDFNPFNDHIVASGAEDCRVMIWTIPEGGLTQNTETPTLTLTGHGRKIWDISTGKERQELTGHTELIQSISWNYDGSQIIQLFDVRSNTVGSRIAHFGPIEKFASTGFSRSSERQNIDTASGLIIPHYDVDTSMLYLAGKGDGNIRYYEWVDDEKGLYAFHPTFIEPISFKVPRKSDSFQADVFPDTIGPEPSLTADEYFAGKLRRRNFAAVVREFVTSAPVPVDVGLAAVKGPSTEKEYQDAYHALRKENEDLKNQVAQREAKIDNLSPD